MFEEVARKIWEKETGKKTDKNFKVSFSVSNEIVYEDACCGFDDSVIVFTSFYLTYKNESIFVEAKNVGVDTI